MWFFFSLYECDSLFVSLFSYLLVFHKAHSVISMHWITDLFHKDFSSLVTINCSFFVGYGNIVFVTYSVYVCTMVTARVLMCECLIVIYCMPYPYIVCGDNLCAKYFICIHSVVVYIELFSYVLCPSNSNDSIHLPLTVLVATIDAQWEGMGDVGSARYEPALLPPCPTIRVLSYSN